MSTWFRSLKRGFRGRSLIRRPAARPILERLEERCLLDAGYLQTNLVSDVPGLATSTDPNLHNPWGMVASSTSPFWVSDQGTGVSTLYNGAGQPLPLVVTIPVGAHGTPPATGPTGIVFNASSTDFIVSQGGNSGHAIFIFATLDGTIAGWSPAVSFTQAVTAPDNSGSKTSYTGLALANNGSGNFLYATNFGVGTVDVFNAQFQPTTLAGSFTDPNLPAGFAPYGIQLLDGKLYVTYFPQNFSPGGLVDVFNTDGTPGLPGGQVRLITGGNLNQPWGLAIAPHDFGQFGNALLVGNVADGHINAYNPHTGAFRGQLAVTGGTPFTEPGLWSLRFGNDAVAGSSDTLFFTAGINGYADGLLGSLSVPEHAVASHHISESIIPNLPPSPTLFVSTLAPTGPDAGDQNPYGIAFVPPHFAAGGPLNPGDILVSNFNNAANVQGTGRTIVRVTPNGQTSVFFQAPADITNVGLTTALGVLRRGFVLVGNVPTTDGTAKTIMPGSLMIIDKNGNLVENLTDSSLLDGPWDLTINDQGDKAQVFVSNVLSGTVTRIDLKIPEDGNPIVESETQIASGYVARPDPMAVVIGPTGLAYDKATDTLYVASTGDNAIFAISDAKDRQSDAGTGSVFIQDNTNLHGPLGLLLAPNGDLVVANGDAVNANPKQPSEIDEYTPGGKFVGQISLNPLVDAAFGIALQFAGPDSQVRFAAVDDNTNSVHVWNIDLDGESHEQSRSSASRGERADRTAEKVSLFASQVRAQVDAHSQVIESLVAAHFAPALGSPQRSASGASLEHSGLRLSSGRPLVRSLPRHAVDNTFADLESELFG